MARKLPTYLKEEEFFQVLKKVKKKDHKAAFAIMFYEALRISEVVGLGKSLSPCCSKDLNKRRDNKKVIYTCTGCNKIISQNEIKRSTTEYQIAPLTKDNIDDKFLKIKGAKGEKDRDVPINPKIKPYLKALPIKAKRRTLQASFKKACKEALNKDCHIHELRHSGVVYYLKVKKWPMHLVQRFVGHSDMNVTMIYAHIESDDLAKAMENS